MNAIAGASQKYGEHHKIEPQLVFQRLGFSRIGSVDDDNDDSWLLNRFRLGLAFKPVSWLKIYGQTQDAREAFSDRSNVPGVRSAEGDDPFDLRQGYIEKSNVNSVGEMSRMVEVMRSYTAIASLLQQQSDLHKSAIEKLADVPA